VDALSFELAGAQFALPACAVHEVLRAVEVEPLPQAPAVIAGVFNLRGSIIAVIDMRKRLGMPPKPLSPDDFFIVVDLAQRKLALWVDRALDLLPVVPLPISEIALPQYEAAYIAGVVPTGEGVLLIQDLPRFLSQAESSALDVALLADPPVHGGMA
jgi:purine-binding chemotaxis protein CheW